uniref:Uncharacterized protein n=1 Tax=Rhizophora mucronata TaxID=61149 RepID=A0A2P2PGF9_RHIMU
MTHRGRKLLFLLCALFYALAAIAAYALVSSSLHSYSL